MAYTTIDAIRAKTDYDTDDITDAQITEIISEATAVINSKINVEIRREQVKYIDTIRQNKINGTNRTFYMKNSFDYYFGDSNNDGDLTIADIKVQLENDEALTTATVSSIDEEGSFVLETAPSSSVDRMYVSYSYCYYDISTPDKLVELLATYLASSYTILVVDGGLPSNTKLGNIAVTIPVANTKYKQFTDKYNELLRTVNVPLNRPRVKAYKSQI